MSGNNENKQESTTNDAREIVSVDTKTESGADGSGLWGTNWTDTTTTTHYSDGTSESSTESR